MVLNEDKLDIVQAGALTAASGGLGFVAGAGTRVGLASVLPGQPQGRYLAVESNDQNGSSGRFSRVRACGYVMIVIA